MKHLSNFSTKGFLSIAQNNPYTDYVRLAYLQALSIKLTQTHNQYAVLVDDPALVPDKYKEVFDHVIQIPWGDAAGHEEWKLSNEWKVIHATPFDQTVKLDSDMLFFEDIHDWWGLYNKHDFVPAIVVESYRHEVSRSDFYRKTFTSNGLPNIYSALMYFTKTDKVFEFFELSRKIFENWDHYSNHYLDYTRPERATTDVVYALAAKILDIEPVFTVPRMVHMKREIQNYDSEFLTEDWTQHLRYYFNDRMELFVENFKQKIPFHYQVKSFATDELIARYEKLLGL